jgi:Lon-like protease
VHIVPAEEKSYALLPGEASSALGRVNPGELKVYRPDGDVMFVTVTQLTLSDLTKEMTRDEAPRADLYTRKELYGDVTVKDGEARDRKLMGDSKKIALFVALKRLGYDVKVDNGGVIVDELGCMTYASDNKTCEVAPPASKVLKSQDLIVEVDGIPINVSDDITTALQDNKQGDTVSVVIEREGEKEPLSLSIELVQGDGRAIIGFIPSSLPPATITFDVPKGVSIDSGDVGGPSAGLAFTLALLEDLTPGSLTGGVKVAATGTIAPSGAVGEIGGLHLKTVAVLRAGAKVFLVPERQKDEAIAAAVGSDLKVIGVRSVDDALKALSELGGNALELGTPGAATGG